MTAQCTWPFWANISIAWRSYNKLHLINCTSIIKDQTVDSFQAILTIRNIMKIIYPLTYYYNHFISFSLIWNARAFYFILSELCLNCNLSIMSRCIIQWIIFMHSLRRIRRSNTIWWLAFQVSPKNLVGK